MRSPNDAPGRAPGSEWDDHTAALQPIFDERIRLSKDEAIALKAAADLGDRSARETLIKACVAYACSLARVYHARTGFDLDECISVAMVGCIECADQFDPARGALLTFVGCRIRTELLKAHRKASRCIQAAASEIKFDAMISDRESGSSPDRIADVAIASLTDAFESLEPRRRQVAEMRYLDGLSYGEIGRRLGVHCSRARKLNRRAATLVNDVLNRAFDEM